MEVALYEEDVLVRTSGFTVDFTTNPNLSLNFPGTFTTTTPDSAYLLVC